MEIREIRTAVGDFLFFERGYRSAVANVIAANRPVISFLKLEGDELVNRSRTSSAGGTGEVGLPTFRLTREHYIERNGRARHPGNRRLVNPGEGRPNAFKVLPYERWASPGLRRGRPNLLTVVQKSTRTP
jgi:hypothetical protein